ncbi:peptide ABC transporter substrate-binding protein [Rubritalea tangerina]|uniref:Peptide ABC transporter substrate-binding protein n=2 Tax=Rubritalea tangerina TaxID=430798 RepID=A0ABW4ZGU1_9BACT
MRSLTFTITSLIAFLTLTSCQDETPVERANKNGILLLGNSDEPKGLDPQLVSGVLEGNIIRALFEGLCVDHPSKNAEALPGVAKSWEANEDFTQWSFHIRENAKWSDGKALTADDFVFSFHRILSPNLGAKYAEMLYYLENAKEYNQNHKGHIFFKTNPNTDINWQLVKDCNFLGDDTIDISEFEEQIENNFAELSSSQKSQYARFKGLNNLDLNHLESIKNGSINFQWPASINPDTQKKILSQFIDHYKRGEPDLWEMANVGVSAESPHLLKLRLRGPVPFLPEITKHYTWFPVPKHAVLKHGSIDTPNTGWTRVGNIVSNGPFKLHSWRFNHSIEVTKNNFYWDKDTVKLNGIRYLPVKNTYTEARMFFDQQLHKTYGLAPEMISYSKKVSPENLRQEPYVGVYFLRLNTTRKPLNNPQVRLALSAAIDSQLLIDNLLQGGQTPAHGIVPQTEKYTTPKTVQFDLTKAKELLLEAGYPNGDGFTNDLKILTTPRETSVRLAEALQAMWKQNLGINVRIEQREWGTFLTTQEDLDYDIAIGGWIGDFLDPTTFLDMWTKGNGNNNTGWSSQIYEDKLKQAERTADPNQRLEILKEAEATILAERPVLPIYWYTTNYLIHPAVQGWQPLLLDNHPFKFIELKQSDSK